MIIFKKINKNYEISNSGDVKSLSRYVPNRYGRRFIKERILKPVPRGYYGYLAIGIHENGKGRSEYIHKLVAKEFVSNPLNKPEVNHKDGNKLNNNDWNLEWVTHTENMLHANINNLIRHNREGCKGCKLIRIQVKEIRDKYSTGNYTQKELAIEYNVTRRNINSIINNRNWKNV
jgi:hypothetical protein